MSKKIAFFVFLFSLVLLAGVGCQKQKAAQEPIDETNQPALEFKIEPIAVPPTSTVTEPKQENKIIPVQKKDVVVPPKAPQVEVKITDFSFEPYDLEVMPGTVVTWRQQDAAPHDIVSPGNFQSPVLKTGETFQYTFSKPGAYLYYCSIHPSMVGKIMVK